MVDTVTVNNTPEPVKTEAEQQAAAIQAAADGGVQIDGEPVVAPVADAPAATERPENVPEKFWDAKEGKVNVDAVLASNKELQAQFTKEKQGEGEEAPAGDETPKGDTPEQTTAIATAQAAYEENGELTEAHYEALEKSGLDKATVDNYIAGQKAIADNVMQHAYSLTQGEENFAAMHEWAGENLSEEDQAAYNAQVMNAETSDYAIAQLFALYSENKPMETDLLNGDNNNNATGEYFKSAAEMQEAMNDKKYKTDPAFRAEVEQKIARADAAGVNLFV